MSMWPAYTCPPLMPTWQSWQMSRPSIWDSTRMGPSSLITTGALGSLENGSLGSEDQIGLCIITIFTWTQKNKPTLPHCHPQKTLWGFLKTLVFPSLNLPLFISSSWYDFYLFIKKYWLFLLMWKSTTIIYPHHTLQKSPCLPSTPLSRLFMSQHPHKLITSQSHLSFSLQVLSSCNSSQKKF